MATPFYYQQYHHDLSLRLTTARVAIGIRDITLSTAAAPTTPSFQAVDSLITGYYQH